MELGSALCVAAEESERGPPRGVARRASEPDLNNLYGLIQPPGQRQFFRPLCAEGRRVRRTLFVNWGQNGTFFEQRWAKS